MLNQFQPNKIYILSETALVDSSQLKLLEFLES